MKNQQTEGKHTGFNRYFAAVIISLCIHGLLPGLIAAEDRYQDDAIADIALLQTAIEEANAEWTAGVSWVTELTPAHRRILIGGVVPGDDSAERYSSRFDSFDTRNLPVEFDWRNVDGYDWMTSVGNQGNCGSCAAFASVASIEALVRIRENDPGLKIDLSEQQVFSCAGGDCPTGLYMGTAFEYIKNSGLVDEVCLPYRQVDDNCAELCDDWQDRVVRIDDWELLWQYTVNESALKSIIMDQPVACYMEVYGDFMSYSSGVYEHVTGNFMGGHFVVIVGWNDADNSWICKNSWGKGWGENGYFRIRRGETEIGSWAMIPYYTSSGPTPTPTPVPNSGVTLTMPQTHFQAGDTFYLEAILSNTGMIRVNMPLFVLLEVAGHYWFWPSWTPLPDIDFQRRNVPSGTTTVGIISPFAWPDAVGGGVTASFMAAILNPDFSNIWGEMDQADWSF